MLESRSAAASRQAPFCNGLLFPCNECAFPGKSSARPCNSISLHRKGPYGFTPKADLLAQLLDLNQQVAARLAAGEPVTAPGLPLPPEKRAAYITEDCIQPPTV